jgi:hypothetical protein
LQTDPERPDCRNTESRRLVIWRITDGKPGHDRQSQGLAEAIGHLTPAHHVAYTACSAPSALRALLRGRWPDADRRAPDPDLIIGAGGRTQLSVLAARRARGGRAIVLMRPWLPRAWFDLSIVPAHDGARADERTLISEGALNPVRPAARRRPGSGLILIGGPSRHYAWDTPALIAQVRAVLAQAPKREWGLADSRRTPAATRAALPSLADPGVRYHPHETTPAAFIDVQLSSVEQAWVTRDSISMIYEALSGGAAVGLLDVPTRRAGRVTRAIDRLISDGRVTPYAEWGQGKALPALEHPLAEARRCAEWVVSHFGFARREPCSRSG